MSRVVAHGVGHRGAWRAGGWLRGGLRHSRRVQQLQRHCGRGGTGEDGGVCVRACAVRRRAGALLARARRRTLQSCSWVSTRGRAAATRERTRAGTERACVHTAAADAAVGSVRANTRARTCWHRNLTLPGYQEQLIQQVFAANPNTVVVLINGGPLSIAWTQQNVPAIVEASWCSRNTHTHTRAHA